MSTVTLPLPDFAVSRSDADELLSKHKVHPGDQVILDGRYLAFNSDSFASQIATRLIEVGPSISVIVAGGGEEWVRDIQKRLHEGHVKVVKTSLPSSI